MFQTIQPAPPDSILGITEAFNKDPRKEKINLSVGIYKDASGKTPVLASVKEAERRLLSSETTKSYLPIEGPAAFGAAVQALLFPADGPTGAIVTSGRAVTAQTPSGTAALRVAADFVKANAPGRTVWMSDPTWPNHPQVFAAAGLACKPYPYFDAASNGLAFDRMMGALEQVPGGDLVLLHGCCHNPTGIDPTPEQWKAIAGLLRRRGLVAFVDFAYQGFGNGLREDGACLDALADPAAGIELIIASSYSKNFGLYNERVGALTFVTEDASVAQTVLSQVKATIRSNYSNPPSHGGSIVTTVLGDAGLRGQWETELADMRSRINTMRGLFVQTLKQKGVKRDFSFIACQRGMFSFSGLSKPQVERLRDEFAVYAVGNGRINVAGMTEANMPRLCEAIAAVVG